MPDHHPLNIWCRDLKAAEAVRAASPRHEVLHSADGAEADRLLAQADVALGHVNPELIIACAKLKWLALTSAGYTQYDREDVWSALRARGAVMTNSSSAIADSCAQHMLAMMLGLVRRIPETAVSQSQGKWQPERGGQLHVLTETAGVLLGFGAIGRRLVELLAPFKMKLAAVRQTVRGDEAIPTFTTSELPRLLGEADHVINLLPESATTTHFLNADRLAMVKHGARIYNIGRGTTIDQAALRDALISGRLAGAFLDVTEPEPLPPGDPLWTTQNLHLTPHEGGGFSRRTERIVGQFLENLRRFEAGEKMIDRIN